MLSIIIIINNILVAIVILSICVIHMWFFFTHSVWSVGWTVGDRGVVGKEKVERIWSVGENINIYLTTIKFNEFSIGGELSLDVPYRPHFLP